MTQKKYEVKPSHKSLTAKVTNILHCNVWYEDCIEFIGFLKCFEVPGQLNRGVILLP